jgi:phosphohistidine swiveling domain-containing protein
VSKEQLMMNKYILNINDPRATLESVGGKGASLSKLVNANFPCPGGFHVTVHAYHLFVESNDILPFIINSLDQIGLSDTERLDAASQAIRERFEKGNMPDDIAQAISTAYLQIMGPEISVAVRSSATAEDLPEASFAGQQSTYLNIKSQEELLIAVKKCWASLWTTRAISYRIRQGIAPQSVALAIVVQQMVPADAAGILFTANPVDGNRDQILINASWGLGESIVGGFVTPDTITVEKSSGKLLHYTVAEKKVETVPVNGGTEEIPVSAKRRLTPVLNKSEIKKLVDLGQQIEEYYQLPMDIEWASSDGQFSILQARPITALPDTGLETFEGWNLPAGAYAAMRNNIVELMADPLTPLFKTQGLAAVNRSMGKLLIGFLGSQEVMPGELIIPVNEYAYYNGSVRFIPIMKIVLDTPGIMRRMFSGAVERWTEVGRPKYIQTVNHWSTSDWKAMSSLELLEAVDQLTEAAVDAYGSLVSGVIPAAWITEAMFTFVYRFLKSENDPPAPNFLMGFDSLPIQAEKSLFDIAAWVQENASLAGYLDQTPADSLVPDLQRINPPAGIDESLWQEWQALFQEHLDRFGHMIYNLDFGNPVPADDPAPLLEALKLFARGNGINPYQRQIATTERREQAVEGMKNRLHGYRLRIFEKNLERAQRYAPLREDGLADVGLSYPLIRQMLAEVGRRLTSGGVLEHAGDIYWLELADTVNQRRVRWQSANMLTPPMMLPQLKVFGFDLMSIKTGRKQRGGADSLKGVGASPGVITAPASVLSGPEDFSKMETGNVLVASITTPAWTPLFARASAVVTDIGGPLSHGSIVAREYGIPAVLGTESATKHISDGQQITVDGNKGLVTLLETA